MHSYNVWLLQIHQVFSKVIRLFINQIILIHRKPDQSSDVDFNFNQTDNNELKYNKILHSNFIFSDLDVEFEVKDF